MVLASYLKNHNLKVDDVIGNTAYSQTQLENMSVISYPEQVLETTASVVGKTASTILFSLLILENPRAVDDIASKEELARAVKKQQKYIYIPESIRTENSRLVNSVLSEKDTLGLELGSAGGVNILGEIIYQFQKMFDKESKEFKELKSKLRRYRVKIHDEGGSILYEKEAIY